MAALAMAGARPVDSSAPETVLAESATRFANIYNGRSDLCDEQRGWTRVIALMAADTGESVALCVDDGRVREVRSGGGGEGADVVITSDIATLRDILELKRSPNEPYIFGELTVRGADEDYLRIDYIATVLCPA